MNGRGKEYKILWVGPDMQKRRFLRQSQLFGISRSSGGNRKNYRGRRSKTVI
jgi:hypothetical protein